MSLGKGTGPYSSLLLIGHTEIPGFPVKWKMDISALHAYKLSSIYAFQYVNLRLTLVAKVADVCAGLSDDIILTVSWNHLLFFITCETLTEANFKSELFSCIYLSKLVVVSWGT